MLSKRRCRPDAGMVIFLSQVKNPFRNILKRRNRPQLVMAIFIPFFQQFTGINAIMFYAPVLFNTIGFGSDASLYSAVIIGAVNVLATFVSIATVDRLGRRALFLEGGVQMLICQVSSHLVHTFKIHRSKCFTVLPCMSQKFSLFEN